MGRAQIKLFESIAVMVVFAFLLVFGVQFYFGIQKTSIQRELLRANQMRVFGLGQKTAFLPELDCAIAGIQQEACMDASKLAAFSSELDDSTFQTLYFPVFGWSTVSVTKIYSSTGEPLAFSTITLYNNTLPGATGTDVVQVPILIYNASAHANGFGYIEVAHYAK